MLTKMSFLWNDEPSKVSKAVADLKSSAKDADQQKSSAKTEDQKSSTKTEDQESSTKTEDQESSTKCVGQRSSSGSEESKCRADVDSTAEKKSASSEVETASTTQVSSGSCCGMVWEVSIKAYLNEKWDFFPRPARRDKTRDKTIRGAVHTIKKRLPMR
jgi:hypothetical protein